MKFRYYIIDLSDAGACYDTNDEEKFFELIREDDQGFSYIDTEENDQVFEDCSVGIKEFKA